jgi:hypothetical protein
MTDATAPTYTAQIYMAGDIAHARQVCRRFCSSGLCVTLEPVEFIYTGGAEDGFRVGLINYPRFPARNEDTFDKAVRLANQLRDELCQHSYSIVTPSVTVWDTTREPGR